MAGCGGNCQCRAQREEQQNAPRTPLSEALAKVIVDNRIVRYAVEFSRRNPEATVDDIVAAVNDAKTMGEI